MTHDLTAQPEIAAATLATVLLDGDLAKLSPEARVKYMLTVCASLQLNHLTKPFEFIRLNGKLVMYARKDATEQLRRNHGVSISIVGRELVEGCYIVTARAEDNRGRFDESIGAVAIDGLKGEARSNALMKAETKAKRRVTLSICGLGMLDETEVDSVTAPVYVPPPAPPGPPGLLTDGDAEENQARFASAMVDSAPPTPEGAPLSPVDASGLSTTARPEAPAPPRGARAVAGGALPANDVTASPGEALAVPGQVSRIHTLRCELPGFAGDHSHPEHPYSRALRAYKKADGQPCASSKDLTFDQAKNFISRLTGLIERKARTFARMEAQTLPPGAATDM